MTANPIPIEMLERYGEPFARALGVFIREMARADQFSAAQSPVTDDRALLGKLRSRAEENDRLEALGQLTPISFDAQSVRQSIAERVRGAMRKRGMSQAQLAQALKVTPANISRILKSPEKSKIETFQRIASALHVDLGEFF